MSSSAHGRGLLVEVRRHDAAEQVAADESAEAGQERGRTRPSEFPIREAIAAERGRNKRRVRQGLHIELAEEMMHHGVARDQNLSQRLLAEHAAQRLTNYTTKFAAMGEFVLQAADTIGAEASLRIQCGFDALDFAAGEIHDLHDQRGGAEIDHRAASGARLDGDVGFVGEHRERPLFDFDNDRLRCFRTTRETPALREVLPR